MPEKQEYKTSVVSPRQQFKFRQSARTELEQLSLVRSWTNQKRAALHDMMHLLCRCAVLLTALSQVNGQDFQRNPIKDACKTLCARYYQITEACQEGSPMPLPISLLFKCSEAESFREKCTKRCINPDYGLIAESCVNDNGTDVHNYDCSHYDAEPEDCAGGLYDTEDFKASEQCCVCGGGIITVEPTV